MTGGLLFTNIFNLQLPLSSGILAPVVNREEWPVIEGGADPVLWSGEKEVGGCSPGRLERYPEVAPGLVLETDPGLEMFQIPHPTGRVLTAVGDQTDGQTGADCGRDLPGLGLYPGLAHPLPGHGGPVERHPHQTAGVQQAVAELVTDKPAQTSLLWS